MHFLRRPILAHSSWPPCENARSHIFARKKVEMVESLRLSIDALCSICEKKANKFRFRFAALLGTHRLLYVRMKKRNKLLTSIDYNI